MDQLRSLRVFVQVMATGSFTKAAQALDMTPAVVTRAVADLEAHLGARLLNRTTRRLALTVVGEAYLDQAKRILMDLDDADALAGVSITQPRGRLRVICPPAFAVHQLARHLPRFRSLYPRIGLELEAPGPVGIANENFDVSILSVVQNSLQGDFIARQLACSSFIACAAPSYLARRGRPSHPDDLLQHDGLLPAVASVRHELTLHRHTPELSPLVGNTVTVQLPPLALSTTHIDMIFASTVAGLGIAGLPSFVAAEAIRDGRLERVLPQWHGTTLTLYAAIPTRKHTPASTRIFIDFLVQTFGGKNQDPWLAAASKGSHSNTSPKA
jgi:DNA-binding transcriptional LysR family regulator